jgi:uncharacterized protein YecA (UPF0149 family)
MENINDILPLLQQMGITPDKLGPERIEKIMQIADQVKDPSQINEDIISQLCNVMGVVNPYKNNDPIERSKKVPRNSKCPCNSGLKWKKCCGKCLS